MRSFNYFPPVAPIDDPDVVDLVPYVRPVRALVGWYDRLVEPGRSEPDIFELDEIVVALKDLPDLPGQLGQDLATISKASDEVFAADIIDAIGRLRRLANLDLKELAAEQQQLDLGDNPENP